MSSYAIIGSGGLGGFYGACLAHAGHNVHFLVREDAASIRSQGWILDSAWGDLVIQSPNVYNEVDQMPVCDFVIVAIKSIQNDQLRSLLPPLIGPKTIAIVLQNGLYVEQKTFDVFGSGRVIGGCCFLCSSKIGPGHIQHLDYGRIEFGSYLGQGGSGADVDAKILEQVIADFSASRVPVQLAANLLTARWRKLMWNIPFNGLSVALNASTAEIMGNPAAERLATTIMTEVQQSAEALGLDVGQTHAQTLLENTRKMVPYDSSMRLDFLASRPMELEYIFANPIHAAKQAGFVPQQTTMLYEQLCFLESRNQKLSP